MSLSCTYSPLPLSELAPLTDENVFSAAPLLSELAAAAGMAEEKAGAEAGTTPSTAAGVVWWPSKLT